MRTEIVSNGSKWAGEEPDGIDALYERLERLTLEPRFGLPREEYRGRIHYLGNFIEESAVFQVITDDAEVIGKLDKLIAANMARPEYKAALAEHDRDQEAKRRGNLLGSAFCRA